MKVYHFMQAKWALENIHKRRIKISRFFDLNDPFELFPVAEADKALRLQWKEAAERMHNDIGVVCFSTSWKNPVMWSHYADRHRGICLGFEAKGLEHVHYRTNRLNNVLGILKESESDWRKRVMTTKFTAWKYESEHRLIVQLSELKAVNGMYFKPFGDELKLVEVIAGARCCINWKDPLIEATKTMSEVNLIKARLSFRKFNVCRQLSEGSRSKGFHSSWAWQECNCKSSRHSFSEQESEA